MSGYRFDAIVIGSGISSGWLLTTRIDACTITPLKKQNL